MLLSTTNISLIKQVNNPHKKSKLSVKNKRIDLRFMYAVCQKSVSKALKQGYEYTCIFYKNFSTMVAGVRKQKPVHIPQSKKQDPVFAPEINGYLMQNVDQSGKNHSLFINIDNIHYINGIRHYNVVGSFTSKNVKHPNITSIKLCDTNLEGQNKPQIFSFYNNMLFIPVSEVYIKEKHTESIWENPIIREKLDAILHERGYTPNTKFFTYNYPHTDVPENSLAVVQTPENILVVVKTPNNIEENETLV